MRSSTRFGDGISFVAWMLLWLLGSVVVIVLMGYDIFLKSIDRIIGRDFSNLWVAGKLVWAGDPGCAFDVNCFRLAMYRDLDVLALQNYSYPPPALFIAAPFALVPYYVALAAWTVLGALFFIWCTRPFLPKGFPPFLAVLTPAATINIWNGHYGFLLGGLWLLCFRNLERKPKRAGIFAGLLTLKPHLGLLIAATIVRNWRALAAAVLTTFALAILSGLAFGPAPWNGFLFGTTAEQQQILTRSSPEFYFRMMPSAFVAFGRGIPGIIAQVISALAAIALLVRHRKWDTFSAATATFLIVPYVFNYDMVVACLGFAIALYARWNSMGWFERATFIVAFVSPELTFYVPVVIPVALLSALHLQLRQLDAARGAQAGPEGHPVNSPASSVTI